MKLYCVREYTHVCREKYEILSLLWSCFIRRHRIIYHSWLKCFRYFTWLLRWLFLVALLLGRQGSFWWPLSVLYKDDHWNQDPYSLNSNTVGLGLETAELSCTELFCSERKSAGTRVDLMKADAEIEVLSTYLIGAMMEAKSELGMFLLLIRS